MSRSWERRGQVEPLAAIAAVAAVAAGLALYAGALDEHRPDRRGRPVAEPTLAVVETGLTTAGVVDPARIGRVQRTSAPRGYLVNVSLSSGETAWRAGPVPPSSAERASQPVSVRVGPGTVRPGRLTVRVWR